MDRNAYLSSDALAIPGEVVQDVPIFVFPNDFVDLDERHVCRESDVFRWNVFLLPGGRPRGQLNETRGSLSVLWVVELARAVASEEHTLRLGEDGSSDKGLSGRDGDGGTNSSMGAWRKCFDEGGKTSHSRRVYKLLREKLHGNHVLRFVRTQKVCSMPLYLGYYSTCKIVLPAQRPRSSCVHS